MEVKDEHLAKLLLGYIGTTLVCTDDEHYKFWNVNHEINPNDNRYGYHDVKLTWGRIGKRVQSKEKSMSAYEIEETIRKKIKKGYEYIDQ